MARPVGRPARVNETRAADTRKNNERYIPPSRHVGKLYIPIDEIPAGMTYSWVDVGQGTVIPEPNVVRANEQSAKGWVPVPRSRHPKFRNGTSLIPGYAATDPYAPFIKVGASLLCERPTEEVEFDKRDQRSATKDQIQSISRWRHGEGADPLMPRFDQSSEPQRVQAAKFKEE